MVVDFDSRDTIKVIVATNNLDILDPALLPLGWFDRKVELSHPAEDAHAKILKIYLRKMQAPKDVVFVELARATEDSNGTQLKIGCCGRSGWRSGTSTRTT